MEKKKKIVVYVDTMNKSGGRERVIANLINKWVDQYKIILITKDQGESFYEFSEDISIISLKLVMPYGMDCSRWKRVVSAIKSVRSSICALKKVLKGFDYDYIYVSTPQNAYEAYKAMEYPEKKLVISEHAYVYAFNKPYMLMKHFVYPKAYCISVPNSMDTEEYMRWNCNAVYIPHIVTFTAEERNALDSKIAINIGRLTADKQQDKLIEMWAQEGKKSGWTLWIVGDGENRDSLQSKIEEFNCEDIIKLLPARRDIKSIYKQASLFLLSSRCEGFGMVLLEAMSFGIPCIAFDCPSGPRDIIKHGINGALVKNGDKKSFQNELKRYFEMDQEQVIQMGRASFDTVTNWDNESILAEWGKIFC